LYNHHIVQKNLGHVTPVAKLKEWQKTHPELFVKKVYNQLRPDKKWAFNWLYGSSSKYFRS
ncbi:MAG: hypothetical protein M1572_00825, partial [Gammaproteobacteria bacterium]|nr:hypothetical protein [Gammaproteobacteria bacterium]